jgi:hypothetical protein
MERYVSFVKEWASNHGLTYMCSIGDPRLKADYAEFKKTGKKPKKSGRASKYQNKEEARLANIAKTNERKRAKKMIQAGTPERMVEAPAGKKDMTMAEMSLAGIQSAREREKKEDANKLKPMDEKIREASIEYKDFVSKTIGKNIDNNRGRAIKRESLAKKWNLPEDWYDSQLSPQEKIWIKNNPIRGEGIFDRGNQMPPSARDYLKKNGDQTITSMRIERIPLGKLQKSLTAIVYVRELLTKFKKPDNIPQDDLFHLQLVLTLSNGRRVMWAKEEVVKLSETIYKGDKMESRELGKTNIKLQDFVDKTAKYMGDKFAPYNAFDNNCQDFIMASLKSNGLGTKADYDFVKQDTKDLFKGRQWLIDMMKGATDLAAAFNVLIEGKGRINNN